MEKLVNKFNKLSSLDKFDYACLGVILACGILLAGTAIVKADELPNQTLDNSNSAQNLTLGH